MPVLEVSEINVAFGGAQVLTEVSLDVARKVNALASFNDARLMRRFGR